MYLRRHLESTLKKISKMFGAVLVTGARQVGKTTLLRNVASGVPYLTLDDPVLLSSARDGAGNFFKDNPPPVIVDEIQYAPHLFPYIKMHIDESGPRGQFFLSGSQQFKMMQNVSESLAGRIGILNLSGLSLREILGVDFEAPFIPTNDFFSARKSQTKIGYGEVWERIYRGSMPEMCVNRDMDWQFFWSAYTKTYIERDVRELTQVGDEVKFMRFMTVAASMTGQLLNTASIARDVGVSAPTAERWLSVLRASNIVYLLEPYHNNMTKRAVKTPKLYFLDTGLAAFLTRWNTSDVLRHGAMAGNFFESFIVSEIVKSYYNAGVLEPPLYFYRDKNMVEIDLLIHSNGALHPIEIKKHADPSKKDIASFRALDKISGIERGPGGVVCMYERLITLDGDDVIIPVDFL